MPAGPDRPRVRRPDDVLTILVFLALLLAPLADQTLGLDATPPPQENRLPAPLPALALERETLVALPAGFDAWYNDHFGFRSRLIRWHSIVKVLWLRVTSQPDVILGKEEWLFKAASIMGGDQRSIDDFRGANPYTPRQLDQVAGVLAEREAWLAERGIRFLLVLAPSKQSIRPDRLPNYYARAAGRTRLDQLVEHLEARTEIQVIDLRDVLIAAERAGVRTYDKTGTHWNRDGAFIADETIARRLARWFPAIRPLSPDLYEQAEAVTEGQELARLLSLVDLLPEVALGKDPVAPPMAVPADRGLLPSEDTLGRPPRATETANPELPRALVLHDSFVLALEAYFSEHFSRAAYYWQYAFDPKLVEHERPDVVIQLNGERSLLDPVLRNRGLRARRR